MRTVRREVQSIYGTEEFGANKQQESSTVLVLPEGDGNRL